MAFLLIVPSTTTRCEWVFGLTTVWTHPCQAHFYTLEETACKLILMVDKRMDWPICLCMANQCAPIKWMTHQHRDRWCTQCGHPWLASSAAHKQTFATQGHDCMPKGLNGGLEALQFIFQELPLWDTAAPGKPIYKPHLIEVDLGRMQPDSVTTTIQVPTTTLVLCPLQLILLGLPSTSPWPSICNSRGPWSGCYGLPLQPQPCLPEQYAKEKATISGPGGTTLNQRNGRSPWARRDGLSHPCTDGNLLAEPPCRWPHPQQPQFHSHYSLTAPALWTIDTGGSKHVNVSPKVVPVRLSDTLLPLQEKINVA